MVAACPGGNISNFLTHHARGNTALSITMTAISTAVAIVMTPFNLSFWGRLHPGARGILKEVALDPLEMLLAVFLLLGLPMVYRLGRSNVFRAFGTTCGLAAGYFFADAVLTDMGARGALNPVVAAWSAHVLFGALGIVLMSTVET